jgi:hypothetical protein
LTVLSFALILVVLALHYRVATTVWTSDLSDYDPAGHFVTGVMVFDYLRHGLGVNPLAFAESYYVKFPRVMLGHWPPAYYVFQALWYFIVPPSLASARLLSAFIGAGIAVVLFRRGRYMFGTDIALLGPIVFLALPSVQVLAWSVMSEMFLSLFVLLTVLSFSDFLDSRSPRAATFFICWSVLAVLTKGSAWALGLFAAMTPLLAQRSGALRNRWYWFSGVLIVLLGAPFYAIMWKMGLGYPADLARFASSDTPVRVASLNLSSTLAPAVFVGVAALGFGSALYTRWRSKPDDHIETTIIAAGAWVLAQILFLVILPLTREGRYYVPALAPASLIFLYGLMVLRKWVGLIPLRSGWLAALTPAVLTLLVLLGSGAAPVDRVRGLEAVADSIPYSPSPVVILLASHPVAEGSLIATRMVHDPWRSSVVLVTDKVLTQSKLIGDTHQLVYDSKEEGQEYVKQLPVRYIIIDESVKDDPGPRLANAIVSGSPDFVLRGSFPILWNDQKGTIFVYENKSAGDRRPGTIRFRLSPRRNSRVMQYTP